MEFQHIAKQLLSGVVICRWSHRMSFEKLESEALRSEVERWLKPLSLKLQRTPSGVGYFAIYEDINTDVKKQAREFFRSLMIDLRFTLDWMELVMSASSRDVLPLPGEELIFSSILHTIQENNSLQESLFQLKLKPRGNSIRDYLEKLFSTLEKQGILFLSNSTSEIYQFTAKLELVQEYLIFIKDVEKLPDIDVKTPNPKQTGLI